MITLNFCLIKSMKKNELFERANFMKIFISFFCVFFVFGCSQFPYVSGSERVINLSEKAIKFYQNNDLSGWKEVVCSNDPEKDDRLERWELLHSRPGQFSNPRLRKISGIPRMENVPERFKNQYVVYEVNLSGYGNSDFLMSFVYQPGPPECVRVGFDHIIDWDDRSLYESGVLTPQ